jgi:hypothetical protein
MGPICPMLALMFCRGAYVLLSAYVFFWALMWGSPQYLPKSTIAYSLILATFGIERRECLGKTR